MTAFSPGDEVTFATGPRKVTLTVIGPDPWEEDRTVVMAPLLAPVSMLTDSLVLVADLMSVFLERAVVEQIAEFWCGSIPTIHIVVGDGCRATLAAEAGD